MGIEVLLCETGKNIPLPASKPPELYWAEVVVAVDGTNITKYSEGADRMRAIYNALERATNVQPQIKSSVITANGINQSWVAEITIDYKGREIYGIGRDTDMMTSGAVAYANAIQQVMRSQPQ